VSEPEPMDHPLSAGTERLLEEVRAVNPRIDWSRVEARLFDENGAVRDGQVVRGRFGAAQIAAGFAIAASFALAFLSPSRATKDVAPKVAVERAPLVEVDSFHGRVLHVGDVIQTGSDGDVLRSEGRLEAHLAPGTRVRILDDGERILLSLESGSIAASVVPVAGGEPFAIDVAGRRVAVHGTKLFVASPSTANGGVVQVAVSEGSAVVGTTHGDGRTEGTLVPGGAIGRFGLAPDVVRDANAATQLVEAGLSSGKTANNDAPGTSPEPNLAQVAPNAPATDDDAPPEPKTAPKIGIGLKAPNAPTDVPAPTTTDVVPPATTNVAPPPVGKGLEAAQVAPTLGKLLGSISQCVPRSSAGITFSISTHMTLSIDPSGTIDSISFDDAPLDPKLAGCVRGVASKFTFPTATAKTTVTRAVVLGDKK
jgi:hypothetical protein